MFSRNIKAFCSDESACHRAHSPGHLFISPLSRLKSNFLFSLCHRTEPMHFSDKTPPLAHRSRKPFFISSMLIKLEVLCTRNLVLCKSRVVFYFPARKPPSCLAVCSKYARDVCVCVYVMCMRHVKRGNFAIYATMAGKGRVQEERPTTTKQASVFMQQTFRLRMEKKSKKNVCVHRKRPTKSESN